MADLIDQLPPYGFISAFYDGRERAVPPPLQGNSSVYSALVTSLVAELSKVVWPRFDLKSRTWVGNARASAMALSGTDLDMLILLARHFDQPVVTAAGTLAPVTHRFFFEEEDGFKINLHPDEPRYPFCAWGESFFNYLPALRTADYEKLGGDFDGAGVSESGGLAMALKIEFQRPRPYQVAMLTGRPAHLYQTAYTADTPSMISGHALQALISGAYVFKRNQTGLMVRSDVYDSWARFVVDVGDRRVFAGVHYPSDSIASWFCALRAVSAFYGAEAKPVREFIWHAISTKSLVFDLVKSQAAYKPLIDWLMAEVTS